jgi:hypothetical protein
LCCSTFCVCHFFFCFTKNHSGLAVMPNTDDQPPGAARDHVFGMASNAEGDEAGQIRRTITMVSYDDLCCVCGS